MDTSLDGGTASPSKAGADPGQPTNKTWRSEWWDFYPLIEKPARPIVWSQASIIFSAHPTQPLITGRHFSSSKQFVLPSPNPVVSSPGSYDPPTVISVTPGDDWMFAYYPRHDAEGLGCLWKRGSQIDNWQVKDFWNFPKNGGAVSATWLSKPREWVVTPSGSPVRLPFRGPVTPVSNPTLVVVTEDMNLFIFFYRYISPILRSIRRSLLTSGATVESSHNPHTIDSIDRPAPLRYCAHAAFSLGYNESSVLIATHTFRKPSSPLPAAPPPATPFNSMDLSVPINLNDLSNQEKRYIDYDTWGEDYNISVHELQLKWDGILFNVLCHNFSTQDIGNQALADMSFLCAPPPLPSHLSGQPDGAERKPVEKGQTYLALTSIDFHGYKAPPTSQITLFSIVQKITAPQGRPVPLWSVTREKTRTFENGVVVHVESFVDLTVASNALVQIFVLDHAGPLPRGKAADKEVPVGMLRVLNLPALSDHPRYKPTTVNYPADSAGRELPLYTAISPNRGLIATLSTSLWKSRFSVHNLPRVGDLDPSRPHPMSPAIVCAILGARSSEDVIHCIASPNIPLNEARTVMFQALHALEQFKNDLPYAGTWDMMGLGMEVYKSRSRRSKERNETEYLEERWKTAHDTCSVAACNIAFEDCREDEGYDLDVVWQLISICSWVVNFAEGLMKTAVLASNTNANQLEHLPDSSPLYSPPLLHLGHPFALQNLIVALKHVKAIRAYLGSLPAGSENSHVAQLVITDTVDSCGIDFAGLIAVLEDDLPSLKSLDSQECQKALMDCNPVPAMRLHLIQLVKKIAESETILNKTRLFIKPSDLVDGIAKLSIESQKPAEKDVVTKGGLAKSDQKIECLRCGGKTTWKKIDTEGPPPPLGTNLKLTRWAMWEQMWQGRCICGGPWLKGMLQA